MGDAGPRQARRRARDLLLGHITGTYYWDRQTETFYMLFVYLKTEQGDLTQEQVRILGKLVHKEFK
jgi:hypothetical protein